MSTRTLLLWCVQVSWLVGLTPYGLAGSAVEAEETRPVPVPYRYTILDRGPSLVRTLVNTPGLNARGDLAIWHPLNAGTMIGMIFHGTEKTEFSGTKEFSLVYPADINDSMVVAGSIQKPEDLRFTRAFRWANGTLEPLEALGGPYSTGNAINSAGDIAGSAQVPGGAKHAVLWHLQQPQDLGLMKGGDYSNARDVNNKSEVVGDGNVTANGRPKAFAWYGGQMHQLPGLAQGTFCTAQALNDAGEIVGSCDLPNGSAHGVIWRDNKIVDLGTLGDEDAPSTALDINVREQVVGSSEVVDGKLRAFLWQKGKMYDLNTGLAPGSGWVLLVASRINDQGEIAGRGSYKGSIHAFILHPNPVPETK